MFIRKKNYFAQKAAVLQSATAFCFFEAEFLNLVNVCKHAIS